MSRAVRNGSGLSRRRHAIAVEPWEKGVVAEILRNGVVVLWSEDTPESAVEMIEFDELYGRDRHYFLVDVTLSPSIQN